ncbi:hypothetical protein Heshes_07960 [Alicyclobacillus hesperidum]|uniref:Anti-repressor SinI n=1 Tax=Alicyclobacillus hesperidum TaxID=89784 RepID=A0A1H2RA53_9BACL|nr:hypothetical protein Heshes_07960 [Alicyclobacillus hesperidum]SDW16366.1 Anti-repressor SinI [Alicyclobacillus hesperidum]
MILVSSQAAETDDEWIRLMITAREMGLSTTEIRSFVLEYLKGCAPKPTLGLDTNFQDRNQRNRG